MNKTAIFAAISLGTMLFCAQASAEIITPESNNAKPGHAHTNLHINTGAQPSLPNRSSPQHSGQDTREPYVPAGKVHTPSSNKPVPGHAHTNIEIFVPSQPVTPPAPPPAASQPAANKPSSSVSPPSNTAMPGRAHTNIEIGQ